MPSERDKDQAMLDSISTSIRRILDVISDCTTESVVEWCALQKGNPTPELQSPAKQIAFLLGLLLTTEEPSGARVFGHEDWKRATRYLRKLFGVYTERYSPDREDFVPKPTGEFKNREIATLAFTDYFQKTLLVADEQVAELIRTYLTPFDKQLTIEMGISVSEALHIAEGIVAKFESEGQSALRSGDSRTSGASLSFYRVCRHELVAHYGTIGERFWELFTVGRGEGMSLKYPTDRSIVEDRPFIRISDDTAIGCTLKEMLIPLFSTGERHLLRGAKRKTYRKFRSTTLERYAAAYFKQMLGESAQVHQNLFESPENQYEHDIVVLHDDLCLFVEAKASPLGEPFRDPERAYVRLLRDFRSDTGIQKAYDQASRLYQSLEKGNTVSLYNQAGNEILQLPSSLRDRAFCICVTRDNHGPTATFLSFLLDKEPTQPYPWVISILDLETMAEAWQYYGWGAPQLKSFLTARERLHATVLGDDELDYVGAYIMHCGLQGFRSEGSFPTPINPTYANIFDDVHGHLRGRSQAPMFSPVYPFESVGETLRTGESVWSMSRRQRRMRLSRNEICPCGSGMKFKRCHGVL